jgi:ribosomal protein L11 methyltransferase
VTPVRKIVVRVPAERVENAMDVLLPLLPRGVHIRDIDGVAEIVALGEPDELSSVDVLVSALRPILIGEPETHDGVDLETELGRGSFRADIGGRLVVRGPRSEPLPDRIDVVIEGTSGFGTGTHPTTRLSLALMLELAPEGEFADLGCGAGALVIAAAKLGWSPAVGYEMLAGSVAEARRNAERNGVEATIEQAHLGTSELPAARVAVVNVSEPAVHARVARDAWPELQTLIASGLEAEAELPAALDAYARAGLRETDRREELGWLAVRLDR